MNKAGYLRAAKISLGVLIALLFLPVFTLEYQGKSELKKYAYDGASFAQLEDRYGSPRYTYSGWDTLPEPYRKEFQHQKVTEDVYYSYQREGMPNYWSFVVAVDSESQTVRRYILWKPIALEPVGSNHSIDENGEPALPSRK